MGRKKGKWSTHFCASCKGMFKAPGDDAPATCRLCGGPTEKAADDDLTARHKADNPGFWQPLDSRYAPPDCGGPYHGKRTETD